MQTRQPTAPARRQARRAARTGAGRRDGPRHFGSAVKCEVVMDHSATDVLDDNRVSDVPFSWVAWSRRREHPCVCLPLGCARVPLGTGAGEGAPVDRGCRGSSAGAEQWPPGNRANDGADKVRGGVRLRQAGPAHVGCHAEMPSRHSAKPQVLQWEEARSYSLHTFACTDFQRLDTVRCDSKRPFGK